MTSSTMFDAVLSVFDRVRKPRVTDLKVLEEAPTVVVSWFWNEDRTIQARIECRVREGAVNTTLSITGYSVDGKPSLAQFVKRAESINARILKAVSLAPRCV